MEPHYRTGKNRILASNCRRKAIPQLLLVKWPMVHPLTGNSSVRDNFTNHFMTDKSGLYSADLNEVSIRDRGYYTDLSRGGNEHLRAVPDCTGRIFASLPAILFVRTAM